MSIWLILTCYASILGLLVGSFLNVVIARLPLNESIVSPRSRCPKCLQQILARDNMPVLSWILLRGKCRHCAHPISSRYPTIELLVGLLFLLLFWEDIPSAQQLNWGTGMEFIIHASFISILVALSFIDIRYYIIPDQLSIYPIPIFIAWTYSLEYMGISVQVSAKEAVLGAFFGGGGLLLLTWIWKLLRKKEGMGMGDIKLLALIGVICGPWPALPIILFLSSMSAICVIVPMSIAKKRSLRNALPFGPFLSFASIIWLLHGTELVSLWIPGAETIFQNL